MFQLKTINKNVGSTLADFEILHTKNYMIFEVLFILAWKRSYFLQKLLIKPLKAKLKFIRRGCENVNDVPDL